MAKGEIARFVQFLLLSLCFQKAICCRCQKASIWGKGLNSQLMIVNWTGFKIFLQHFFTVISLWPELRPSSMCFLAFSNQYTTQVFYEPTGCFLHIDCQPIHHVEDKWHLWQIWLWSNIGKNVDQVGIQTHIPWIVGPLYRLSYRKWLEKLATWSSCCLC